MPRDCPKYYSSDYLVVLLRGVVGEVLDKLPLLPVAVEVVDPLTVWMGFRRDISFGVTGRLESGAHRFCVVDHEADMTETGPLSGCSSNGLSFSAR